MESSSFKCSVDEAKRSFYTAANAIFGNVSRLTSEEVTLQLFKTICIPILLYCGLINFSPIYGLEGCPLNKLQISFIDFVIERFVIKLFNTSNIETEV